MEIDSTTDARAQAQDSGAPPRLMSDYYTRADAQDPWQPYEASLGTFLGSVANQQHLLEHTTLRPAIHALARDKVVRVEVDFQLPATPGVVPPGEVPVLAAEARLLDLLAPDHPLHALLVDRRGDHTVFVTDMVIQEAASTLPAPLGVHTNMLSINMWGFDAAPDSLHAAAPGSAERQAQVKAGDSVMKQRHLLDQGFVYEVQASQKPQDVPPQLICRISEQERVGIYTYGGRCWNGTHDGNAGNVARHGNGIVWLSDTELAVRAHRPGHPAPWTGSKWAIIGRRCTLYDQLMVYQQAAQAGTFVLHQEAFGPYDAGPDRDPGTSVFEAFLAREHPAEAAMPLPFTLNGAHDFALVPAELLATFLEDAPAKLFYYLTRESPIEEATIGVRPIAHSWPEAYALPLPQGAAAVGDAHHVRLTVDLRLAIFHRATLATAVCRPAAMAGINAGVEAGTDAMAED